MDKTIIDQVNFFVFSRAFFDAVPLKGLFTPKWTFCHHLFTLHLFQTCMIFFLLFNTKEDILKNVGDQTVDGSPWLP